MASSLPRKLCEMGNDCKQTGVAHCEGCSQVFCTKHFNEHRRTLDEEMNAVLSGYNECMNTITQESNNSNLDPLIQKIDSWEKESIEKIQQKATELRQELLELKTTHLKSQSTKLQSLAGQLEKSREYDDFSETDLRQWRRKLHELKSNRFVPSMIYITQDDNTPLTNSISLNFSPNGNELFDRVLNNGVRIEEDGEVVVGAGFLMAYSEIRGKNKYMHGYHNIRLQIEHASNHWTFLGINSQLNPLQKASYSSKSAYGWCSDNNIYSGGTYVYNKTSPMIRMNTNDIISLFFDCDYHKIVMINERTSTKHELIVDINNCPFPWQLHVIIKQKNSRIRILPT
jgi:hypothetical protein